ncbi:DUF4129 domain-containing protein [Helcobacillus massiliensis]|uniref:DUF4129 domain-containing protein n=1 Tax=Helcobacillus TaxID=1161125 RepID=UPI001EF4D9FD|nr:MULTISPECIES: DUF4129 domain-containing protein [Helcobacillus]MCG7426115.1 DUF4129 domain-containing protein [Helcobacillus sp. ACRRO]MCT1557752.1 DUF4129 domain-containing protein [Helcobacillus massiliensis]MCT2036024.1 DUF4129 domain-containing protein [Helcobacillus massiliensis]MCT2331706.1 DUF4129 domain-containing protein [Helcobacillus massiliensis]MDK7741455.1 DUF4129 domain-containing protein [Helcobacillus massiliensis]
MGGRRIRIAPLLWAAGLVALIAASLHARMSPIAVLPDGMVAQRPVFADNPPPPPPLQEGEPEWYQDEIEPLRSVLDQVLTVLLWAVIVAAALALLWLVVALVRRAVRSARAVRPDAGAIDTTSLISQDDAAATLSRARSRLVAEGTAAEAIIAAWRELERAAEDHGHRRLASDTPSDHMRRALRHLPLNASDVDEFADLFRQAMFSPHPLGEVHRARAVQLLDSLLADLDSAPAVSPSSRGGAR